MRFRAGELPRTRALLAGAAAACALALPPAASAGTLTVDHGASAVIYTALPGEANNLSIYRLSDTYRIQDEPAGSIPLTEIGGLKCTMGEPWKYRCPVASVATATVSLGDGADVFNASNSSVALTVLAGADSKRITTGSGADRIAARNGSADQIACGAGADIVEADASDSVDASCEQVNPTTDTGGDAGGTNDSGGQTEDPTGGPSGTGDGDSPTVFETPVGLIVARTNVPVSNERARVALECAADAEEGCRGDVTLEWAKKASAKTVTAARGQYVAQQRRRGRRIGKSRYRLAAGEKATVVVPVLLRGHYRYVSRHRRLRRVLLRITERDRAGAVIDVQTRTVTLTRKRGQR